MVFVLKRRERLISSIFSDIRIKMQNEMAQKTTHQANFYCWKLWLLSTVCVVYVFIFSI